MVMLNIDMPASCEVCKFKGDKWCYVEVWMNRGAKEVPEEGRAEWCPMEDVSKQEDDLK